MNNMTNFELLINLNEIERDKEWKPKFQQKKNWRKFRCRYFKLLSSDSWEISSISCI